MLAWMRKYEAFGCADLFGYWAVIKANDPRELPVLTLVLPEHDELGLSHVIMFAARMMEAVGSDLDCAKVRDWIDLECSGNELSETLPQMLFLMPSSSD